jgi:hypothetical protein
MMSQRRVLTLSIIAILAIVIGNVLLPPVALERQFNLATNLSTMSAALFTILGVWIAVLDPKMLLSGQCNESHQKLMLQLLTSWLQSTFVLAATIITATVLALAPESWYTNAQVARIFGSLLSGLALLLLYTLTGTLIPIARLRSATLRHGQQRVYRP